MGTRLDTRLYVSFVFATFFVLNDATYPVQLSLPPFELLAPLPLTKNMPPYCVNYPPSAPQPPPTAVPTPPRYSPSPSSPPTPKFPIQSPPPSPPKCMQTPKPPPQHEPTPPCHGPSPPPPFHRSSTARPPPLPVPAPPHRKPQHAVWCVAKPTVPDAILQEALDYACGSGADCKSIQSNGPCFQPNTLLAHASYAFNSYWQNAKTAGGTCDFGGTAMLVTVDPSKYSSFVLGDFGEAGSVNPGRSAVGRFKSGCIYGSYVVFQI